MRYCPETHTYVAGVEASCRQDKRRNRPGYRPKQSIKKQIEWEEKWKPVQKSAR